MTTPTPLSPAAQAVLDAASASAIQNPCGTYERDIAAALRAAADQVVPVEQAPKLMKGVDLERLAQRQHSRAQILAIADELDGTSALEPNDLSHLSEEEFQSLAPQGYHAP